MFGSSRSFSYSSRSGRNNASTSNSRRGADNASTSHNRRGADEASTSTNRRNANNASASTSRRGVGNSTYVSSYRDADSASSSFRDADSSSLSSYRDDDSASVSSYSTAPSHPESIDYYRDQLRRQVREDQKILTGDDKENLDDEDRQYYQRSQGRAQDLIRQLAELEMDVRYPDAGKKTRSFR